MRIKLVLLTISVLMFYSNIFAHYLWIETNTEGKIGETQTVNIFYGEFSYNIFEEVNGNFKEVSNFTVWLVTPDNQKIKLDCTPQEDRYVAEFTPDKEGTYLVMLNNETIDVKDWREYGLGILKPNFYSSASVLVGDTNEEHKTVDVVNNLVVLGSKLNDNTYNLKVTFKNKPLAKQELVIGINEGWTKTVYTDENGSASFSAPWARQYLIETIYNEETSGSYNETDYELIRHCATYSIKASE